MQSNTTLASYFSRWLAYIIDALILAVPTFGTFYFLVYERNLPLAIILTILGAAYKPVMESWFGWTLGKRMRRIKVIDLATGGRIDFNQSLMRYLPWAIGAFASIFVLIRHVQDPAFAEISNITGYMEYAQNSQLGQSWVMQAIQQLPIISAMWLIFDPLRQALHDKLARSLVVVMRKDIEGVEREA